MILQTGCVCVSVMALAIHSWLVVYACCTSKVAILELVRKVAVKDPREKGKCMKIIISLMQSKSTAVTYECAVTLTKLSQAPTAIRAACQCFCQLLISQSDNNVKLIVLDRLKVLTVLKFVCQQV